MHDFLPSILPQMVHVIFLMGAARKMGTVIYVTGIHLAMGITMAGGNHVQVTIMVHQEKQTWILLEVGRVCSKQKLLNTECHSHAKRTVSRNTRVLIALMCSIQTRPSPHERGWHLGCTTWWGGDVVYCRMLSGISGIHLSHARRTFLPPVETTKAVCRPMCSVP